MIATLMTPLAVLGAAAVVAVAAYFVVQKMTAGLYLPGSARAAGVLHGLTDMITKGPRDLAGSEVRLRRVTVAVSGDDAAHSDVRGLPLRLAVDVLDTSRASRKTVSGDDVTLFLHGGPGAPLVSGDALHVTNMLGVGGRIVCPQDRGAGECAQLGQRLDDLAAAGADAGLDRAYFEQLRRSLTGGSPMPIYGALNDIYGIAAKLRDVQRIVRTEELCGARASRDGVTLVGHSFGGLLSTLFAAEFPESVKKIVLLAPASIGLEKLAGADIFTKAQCALAERGGVEDFKRVKARTLDFSPRTMRARTDGEWRATQEDFADQLMAAYPGCFTRGNQEEQRQIRVVEQAQLGGFGTAGMYIALGKNQSGWDAAVKEAFAGPLANVPVTMILSSADPLTEHLLADGDVYSRLIPQLKKVVVGDRKGCSPHMLFQHPEANKILRTTGIIG